jgi:hypothetical protein
VYVTDWKVPESSPRVSSERVRRFLESYCSSEFRHREELVPIMQRNDSDVSRIAANDAQLDDHLRSVYRVRAKTTASRPSSPYFPTGLADDVRELVTQLDAAKDQPLRFWHIDLPSGICFIVFELVDDGRVAGCVKSADQRVVNPNAP